MSSPVTATCMMLWTVAVLALLCGRVDALSCARSSGVRMLDGTKLRVSSSPLEEWSSSSNNSELAGPAIDFGSVKDSTSRAERALWAARLDKSASSLLDGGRKRRLVGISDETVKQVGREIGEFADAAAVQRCAAYLRSIAPTYMFEPADAERHATFGKREKADFSRLLRRSYEESGILTEAFAKTFYIGTQLLPLKARRAIWAVYVWCRRTDEIVDAPRLPDDDTAMLADLSRWEVRLENLFRHGAVTDVLDLPLLHVRISYPHLPIQPFLDMIRGMLMDVPHLGQDTYQTFDELHLYCYRVAGTVGLMSMPIFGCAPGFTHDQAKEPALSLGVAFQLTNILRDVGEDASLRNRFYLPARDRDRFGVTQEQMVQKRMNDNYRRWMIFEIRRARLYYARARRGIPMLSPHSRLPVQTSLDCYEKILTKIERNGYDNLTQRAYVSKLEKLLEIPFSWYRLHTNNHNNKMIK